MWRCNPLTPFFYLLTCSLENWPLAGTIGKTEGVQTRRPNFLLFADPVERGVHLLCSPLAQSLIPVHIWPAEGAGSQADQPVAALSLGDFNSQSCASLTLWSWVANSVLDLCFSGSNFELEGTWGIFSYMRKYLISSSYEKACGQWMWGYLKNWKSPLPEPQPFT